MQCCTFWVSVHSEIKGFEYMPSKNGRIKIELRNLVRLSRCLASLIIAMQFSFQASALPFEVIDARSAAMGGTGLVTDARNSAYHNPALLASIEEDVDAIAIAPAYGKSTIDPDDVESQLDYLNNAIRVSDTAAQDRAMSKLTDKVYLSSKINSVAFIVPSETVGANASLTNYRYHSARPVVDTTLAGSTMQHRSIDMTEYSINVGTLMDLSDMGIGLIQVGGNVKMMLIESYGYSQALAGSNLGFERSQVKNGSAINFGFGLVKELGVWKIGFTGRNLINETIEYGHSNTYFHIKPQFRAGMAYQSRRAIIEFDIDLTENEKIGFGEPTSYAAAGWEYRILGKTLVRAGLRQNLVGNKNLTGSAGVGIGLWKVNLDFAAMASADEKAVYANIAFEI